jgi:glycerol-3-phosphate dehydrogenase
LVEFSRRVGVPIHSVKVNDVSAEVPMFTCDVERAHWVSDGVLEGFTMLSMLAQAIELHGYILFNHTKAPGLRGNCWVLGQA